MALWDWLFGSSTPQNSTDISDYDRSKDFGPGDVGISQSRPDTSSTNSSSLGLGGGGGMLGSSNYSWRDLWEGLAQAGAAAGADNRYLPPGLAIGAFAGGATRGIDAAQENRLKLEQQFKLQAAQAQNLLASGDLAKAQASAVPSEIDQRKAATDYQRLVTEGYPRELAARLAETGARTGLLTGQTAAIPGQMAETAARTAYQNALTAKLPEDQALVAAQTAYHQVQTMIQQAGLQRQLASDALVSGRPVPNLTGSPIDQFEQQLVPRESSGNPTAQTPVVKGGTGGYSGLHQFGADRLAELGYYTPGPGERGPDGKWNGQWNGTFQNVPVGEGQSQVKTIQDFLNNPAAQKAIFAHHVSNIDSRMRADGLINLVGSTLPDGTPITVDGMRAAAHLGGYDGMKHYVMTIGRSNPTDRLGTSVGDYMRRFAGGGAAAPAASFASPAQRTLMGGGGAPGGGFGGLAQPGYGNPPAAPPAPSIPTAGGGFGARAGAPLNPQQSILNGGGDVLSGLPQPSAPPAQFAGPGVPTAPLNPAQATIGGFGGPGLGGGTSDVLGGGGGPAVPPVVPPPAPAPVQPAPPAAAGTNQIARMTIPEIIQSMPEGLRQNMVGMTVEARAKFIADYIEKKATQPVTVSGADAAALGFGPFNDNAVIKLTPQLYGKPIPEVIQPGVSPKPVYEQEAELRKEFNALEPVKEFLTTGQHLDQVHTLVDQWKANPSGTSSAALIIQLGKLIAPQAVRGTEQQMLTQASGMPGVQQLLNKINYNGSNFRPEDMQTILDTANGLQASRLRTVGAIAEQFRAAAGSSKGVNADRVVDPKLFPPGMASGAGAPGVSTTAPPPMVVPPVPAAPAVPTTPPASVPAPSAKATLEQVFANAKPAPQPDVPATSAQPQTGTQRRVQVWKDRLNNLEQASGLKPKPSADADPQVKAWQQAIAQQPSEVLNGLTVAEFQALPKVQQRLITAEINARNRAGH
jgi:hypothetical protein